MLQSGDFPFPNLSTLKLEYFESTSSIESSAFSPVTKLKILYLENMPAMTILPFEALNQVWKLEGLHLKGLHLPAIYRMSFNTFSNLKYLNLHYNEVPLTIQHNAFGRSANTLTHLNLQNNGLTNLNFLSAENFPNLTHLDLSYNYALYQALSATTFSRLSALTTLIMQDIGLTNVRQSMFTGISRMVTLDISYNYIGTIETAAFSMMPELTKLRLASQTAGSTLLFQTNAFDGISSLQNLLVQENTINFTAFWPPLESLSNLLELNLENTKLHTLNDYAFRYNTKLNTLRLRHNSISSINKRTFFGPHNTLQTLDLSSNQLHTVDACLFSDFPTKPTFYFTENPLVCNCNLVWLYDWVLTQQTDTVLFHVGQCGSPASRAGKYMVVDFTKDAMCPINSIPLPNCSTTSGTATTDASFTTLRPSMSGIKTTNTPTTAAPELNIGLITGLTIGSVVLVTIAVAIMYLFLSITLSIMEIVNNIDQ